MKLKRFILIAVVAVGAGSLGIIAIGVLDQKRETEARQEIQTATTNMMKQMKPLTAPPIFPEKN
jgi:Tfp pilus assembly protein PilV